MDNKIVFDLALQLTWKVLYYTYENALGDSLSLVPDTSFARRELSDKAKDPCLRYALHRFFDDRPTRSSKSPLRFHIASLMAQLAIPGEIYEQGSPEVAFEFGACLMQTNGWGYKRSPERFRNSILEFSVTDKSLVMEVTHQYQLDLNKHWRYTGVFRDDLFERIEEFAEANGNNIYAFV